MCKTVIIFSILLFVSLIIGCTYKNVEEVYPETTVGCDTTNISYKGFIQPLLSTNCYSCHSQANSGLGGGFVLDTWLNVKSHSDNNDLIRDLTISDLSDPHHMPNGLPSLSACEINKVKAWVNAGAQNN